MESNKSIEELANDLELAINRIGQYAIDIGVFSNDNLRADVEDYLRDHPKTKRTSLNIRNKATWDKFVKWREDTGRSDKDDTERFGITNAGLMFIHENGSPLHHIPARPVLQKTINYVNEGLLDRTIDKALNALFESNFDKKAFEDELEKLCMRMESYARKLIYSNDGQFAPNAPSTIAKKGDNHPLFDTGQLARSITCKLVKL